MIVANTHLYYQHDADHIRLFQAFLVARAVENAVQDVIRTSGMSPGVVVCGDFNCVPECPAVEVRIF